MQEIFLDNLIYPLILKSITFKNSNIPIDLNVFKGSLTVIVGAENSGKSVLCKKIAGLENQIDGSILYYGKSFENIKDHNLILYIPSANIFFESRTVIENLVILSELANIPLKFVERRIKNISSFYGLNNIKNTKLYKLTKSIIPLLNLALIEIIKPQIVIISTQEFYGDQLREDFYFDRLYYLKHNGFTIVLATQRLKNIRYADNIILLSEFKPIFVGNPSKISGNENPKEIELFLLKKIEESYETG